MSETNIEWATHSLNPYGWVCTKRSPGCQNCYMMTLAQRRQQSPTGPFYTRWPEALRELRRFPAGSVVFVNSMSDTYLERAPDQDVHRVHNMVLSRPDVFFLVLTKRPERPYYMRHLLAWPDNLWLGVSVESRDYYWRIDYALATPAKHVFISAEPLLENIGGQLRAYLTWKGWPYRDDTLPSKIFNAGRNRAVEWVILGGESGDNRRDFSKAWAVTVKENCQEYKVPFMFKQGSSYFPGKDRLLGGRTWDERPKAFGKPTAPKPEPVKSVPIQLSLFEAVL